MRRTAQSVVVGLSSGVDSTVAAWLLKQQGYKVIAVTFALADGVSDDASSSCCSPLLMARAKAIADHLGIPHYAIDLRAAFREQVVDYFVSEYSAARTPNPCAKCNWRVRFPALVQVADRLGADLAATGHYARLTGEPARLSRGVDAKKDQSYVLAEVDPLLLERCLFPLGEMTKTEVRRVSASIGAEHLVSDESQEICFVQGKDYRGFLRQVLGVRPGRVVDGEGVVIGRHQGTYNFTIGQRKGLGHAAGRPLYVTGLDAQSGDVFVGSPERGPVDRLMVSVSAVHRRPPRGEVQVQVRSMGDPLAATLEGLDVIVLHQPTAGVAPGQTAVVYSGDDVLLGGTIAWAGAAGASVAESEK